MDLEPLRKAIRLGLESMSAEELAKQAGSVTAQTVRNFAKDGHSLRAGPRRALQAWAARQAPPAAPAGAPRASKGEIDPVFELIRTGQAEQAAWVLEFAARVLEAGARRLRLELDQQAMLTELQTHDALEARTTKPKATKPRRASGR